MAQPQAQFTPVQVLQAARRAEAEGKMDYALQFYRHLVEHHGTTIEAQEAREGLFRIAEWRWGEARIARRQEAGGGQNGHHAYSGAASAQAQASYAPEPAHSEPAHSDTAHMPQIIAREAAAASGDGTIPAFKARYRAAKIIAFLVSGLGWASVLAGAVLAVIGPAGTIAEVSAAGMLGLPLGVLFGVPALTIGLVLVVAGQLAVAVFESTNATLELLAIERGRLSF